VASRNGAVEIIVAREILDSALAGYMPPRVEYATLANIGREEIETFHKRHVTPAGTTLILSGDFNTAELRPKVEALFGDWKPGPAPPVAARPGPARPAGVRFAELARSQSAAFAIGTAGPQLGSPDAAAASILSEVLTGGPNSVLQELARRHPSWQLRPRAGLELALDRPGLFSIRGLTDTPYPVEAVNAILGAAEQVRNGGVTDAAIEAARKIATSGLISQFPSAMARLSVDESARRSGIGSDFAAGHWRALQSATRADVLRVARSLLDPQVLHIVVAGNATLLNRPVSEVREPVKQIDLSIPAAQPLQASTDPAAIEQGKAWFARLQSALGGIDKILAIKDLEVVSKGTQGLQPIQITDRWIGPGTIRQDQETPAGVISVFYNGEIGWIGTVGRIAPLNQSMLMQARGELLRLLPLLAASDRNPARSVSHAGGNAIVITGPNGTAVRLYVDESTNLPVRLVYASVTPAGLPSTAEETWSDWIESGGLKFPGKSIVRMDGRQVGSFAVTSVKVNSGLRVADLEKKP
jgi:hypothetical protein